MAVVNPTISVSSADAFAAKIQAAGGTIVIPRTDIPGVGVLVTFKDPSGNIFSILEPVTGGAPAVPCWLLQRRALHDQRSLASTESLAAERHGRATTVVARATREGLRVSNTDADHAGETPSSS